MAKVAFLFALIALLAWFVFGNPSQSVANALWAHTPAPWEDVTGFYYPNKLDHAVSPKSQDSGTISQCREWAQVTIAASLDPDGQSSDYACGIGCSSMNDASTCRTLVK
ncbi:MAG TPA: hypothetical protein VGN56_03100 [Candidatus Paceibacterota bacterium]|jgi:hypothetical protein|nr:hypothetical protein [Candidatus Paceibacterota bacterium]